MAEQQEEMSMNEILSSIKDILVENENPSTPSPTGLMPPEPHPVEEGKVVDTAEEMILPDSFDIKDAGIDEKDIGFEENEDILELSPDMAVEPEKADNLPQEDSESNNINLADNFADINLMPEIIDDKGDDEPEPAEENISFDGLIEQKEEQKDVVNAAPAIDTESDPYYEDPEGQKDVSIENGNDFSEPVMDSQNPAAVEDEISSVSATGAEAEASVPISEMSWPEPAEIHAETKTEEPVWETSEPQQVISQPEPSVQKEPAIENVPSVDEEVADVSANIINNFAKLFAKEESPAVEQAKPTLEIAPVSGNIKLGDSSQTLEDMLKSAIQGLVADWVSGAKSNIDLYDMVSKEVARQTKVWLDANLPAVVESVVKKEIERVMVKVGRS